MTRIRRIAVLSPLIAAGIVGAWWLGHTLPAGERPAALVHAPAPLVGEKPPIVKEPVAEEPASLALVREGKQPLSTEPATAPAAKRTAEARDTETTAAQLKLALPDMPTDAVNRLSWAADVMSLDESSAAAFDFSQEEPVTPKVESITLFNPEYGLSGFLKQRWLSQRFGLQGGLGLNDDRRIETDDGLRDNIAVGMGIILTF